MAAPDYDAMEDMAEGEEESADDAAASDLDSEFLMHAEGAGLSAMQAESLKLAIERCMALKDGGDYDVLEEEDVEE